MGYDVNPSVALEYLESPVWMSVDRIWPPFQPKIQILGVQCKHRFFEANTNYQVLYGVDLLKLDFNIC